MQREMLWGQCVAMAIFSLRVDLVQTEKGPLSRDTHLGARVGEGTGFQLPLSSLLGTTACVDRAQVQCYWGE